MPGWNSEICETQLSRVPLRIATSPLSGFVFPYRIPSSVDFPEPFGPMTPMRSPSDTVKEIFLNSGAAPYLLDSPWALISGGKFLGLLPSLVYPEERHFAARRVIGSFDARI
jgi:hypothetical protein